MTTTPSTVGENAPASSVQVNIPLAFVHSERKDGARTHVYTVFKDGALPSGGMQFRKGSPDNDVHRDKYCIHVNPYVGQDGLTGRPTLFLPGDAPRLCQTVEFMLRCEVSAIVQKQAWYRGSAVDVDDPAIQVNVAPALARLSLDELHVLFGHRGAQSVGVLKVNPEDLVHNLLDERVARGPYRASIEESDVLHLVAALNAMPDAFGDNDRVLDIEPWMWDDFCTAVKKLHPTSPPGFHRLEILGHRFEFQGVPGQACQIRSTWAYPFEDDAVKLAHHTVESCLLSAYSSGALFHDGQFDARLVDAFRTTLDQMPALVERADPQPLKVERHL